MKTQILKPLYVPLFAGLLGSALLFTACEQNKDSADVAKDQNDERFENVNDDNNNNGVNNAAKVEQKDADFVLKAANIDMAEIYVSRQALAKSNNAEVKRMAQMMVDEHTKTSEQLKSLATTHNISLPTEPSQDDVKNWKGLLDKTGADFDKDYADWLVSTHKDAVDNFEDISKKEDYHPDIRNLATNTLPALRHHLTEAERLRDMLKGNNNNNNNNRSNNP